MNNDERSDLMPKQTEIDLRDYWRLLLKRKWLVFAFALIVFAVTTVLSFVAKPVYTAKGTLQIQKEANILSFEQIFQVETFLDDYYQTQYKILQSRSLADRVIEKLKLYENEEFVGKPDKRQKPIDKSDSVFRSRLIDAFLGRLTIKPIRLTRLAEVNFTSSDPKLAADGVNALFQAFIDMNIESKSAATEQAAEFLTNQIASSTAEIQKRERELQTYGAQKNIVTLSDKETTIIDKLTELNKALTQAQIDRANKEADYNEIKNASSEFIPDAMANPLIQRMREEYGRLRREFAKRSETWTPEYPEMQRLKLELESAKKTLETETQNFIKTAYSEFQAALKRERGLQEIFNKQKQEAIQMNSNAIAYNGLKIELESNKALLDSLLKRQSETGVSARLQGMRTSNIKVVDHAEVPRNPSSPKKKLNMILGLFFGIVGGIGLAFFFEYLDNSVKSAEDVEKSAKLPTLGIIPTFSEDGFRKGYGYSYGYGYGTDKRSRNKKDKDKSGTTEPDAEDKTAAGMGAKGEGTKALPAVKTIDLIAHFSPRSNFSESYRSIRTALLLSAANPNLKAVVITSPLPSEGKTSTVSNLAVSLAQAKRKVLLVDADLRKPRQHRIFKIKNSAGLTNYLTSDLDVKELIKPTFVPNLYLINSGPVPPNPVELLGSERMAHFIENLKQTFDFILFDTPPVLPVTDALVLGPSVDGVVMVIWGGKTSREALKRSKEKLELTKIRPLGVIINRLSPRESEYYYKHYYHYYGETGS